MCLSSYIDELSKQLKKEFPLASPTKKDSSVERDDVVHIYYKVWMKAEIFLLSKRSKGCNFAKNSCTCILLVCHYNYMAIDNCDCM